MDDYKLTKSEEAMYTKLYKQYRKDILNYVYSRTRDADVALEVASKVFIKLFTNWRNIKQETARAWLYTVAKNEMMDHFRSKSRTTSLDDEIFEERVPAGGENVEKLAEIDIKSQKVKEVVKGFQPKAREIFALKIYDELTFAEIAEVMGINEGAVKMMYYRSLEIITKNFENNLNSKNNGKTA